MKNKIGKSAKLLMLSDLIYVLTGVFINTFLVAYFMEVTNDNMTKIAIYYITIHVLRIIGVLIIARFVKKRPAVNREILSLGIVTRALFILFIVILAEKIAMNFIAVAIIFAISEILYWCSHEVIYINVTTNDNRKKYMSTKKVLEKIVTIIAPVIFGTSIELYSFTKIAVYVFILSFIEIILTLFIKNPKATEEVKDYDLKGLSECIRKNKLRKLKYYAKASIAYGIVEKTIGTIIVIITVMTFKTSFNLGMLTTVFAFCSMIAIILYNKSCKTDDSKVLLMLISLLVVFGVVGLLIDINKMTLVLYNFCYMIGFGIFDVLYNTRKGNLVKETGIEEFEEEYIVYATAAVSIGRIIGYSLLLITSLFSNIIIFKVLLAVVTLFAPVYSYLILKTEE